MLKDITMDGNAGECVVAFFSAMRWDRRNRADLIESATPCHDTQEVGSYRVSSPLCLTVLAAKSEDHTAAPQHMNANYHEMALVIKELLAGIIVMNLLPREMFLWKLLFHHNKCKSKRQLKYFVPKFHIFVVTDESQMVRKSHFDQERAILL